MIELYYFPAVRMNAKIAELVDVGNHIDIGSYRYERLFRKPKGRSIERRLVNENENTRIIIYK
tara:strand:+ start:315 stop:503 length:189 start_codon:yes stop_codon:yes gene_type:complete